MSMFSSYLRKQYRSLDEATAALEPTPLDVDVGGDCKNDGNCVKTSSPRKRQPIPPSSRVPQTASTTPKSSTQSQAPVLTGDYHVLRRTVVRQRDAVRIARSNLGSTLNRLGEHHIRNGQYDEAMDAFVEALHEKRSAYMTGEGPVKAIAAAASSDNSVALQEQTVATAETAASSLLSGMSESSSYMSSSHVGLQVATEPEERARELGEIVATLSSIGNVHSLRGEHAEAMRYYTEVTSLRHAATSSRSPVAGGVEGDASAISGWSGSSLSGGRSSGLWKDEDNSTIFSDLNEDVKALDDLFESISFRNKSTSSVNGSERIGLDGPGGQKVSQDSRRSSSRLKKRNEYHDAEVGSNNSGHRTRPREEQAQKQQSNTSTLSIHSNGEETSVSVDQLSRAITLYRSLLDSYIGQNLEEHEQEYMNFIDKITILRAKKQREEDGPEKEKQTSRGESLIKEELHLALGVYDRILSVQRDVTPPSPDDLSSNAQQRRLHISGTVASTLIAMGSIHYSLGHIDEELLKYEEALAVYTEALGPTHPYVAGTCKNIGMVLAERCDFDAAMERFRQARDIYSRVAAESCVSGGGKAGTDLASALSCMGNVQNRRGELDDALNLYGEALHIYRTIAETEEEECIGISVSTASAMQNVTSTLKIIGMVYAKKGHLDKAMECFQEAMSNIRSYHGIGGGAATASILTRIAGILYKQSQYDNALSTYREAYDLSVQEAGTVDHPDIAGILHYIGCIHHKLGRYAEAVECYRRAVDSYRASLGPDCPNTATSFVCMGSIYFKKRDLDSALSYYSEALRLTKGAHGPHHPDVAPTLKSIGMIRAKRAEYDEAMECFQELLLLKSAVLGQVHPDVAKAYKNIGNVHFKKGEYGTAERQYRQALAIYRKALGDGHPDTQATVSSIDHIRRKMRDAEAGGEREARDTQSSHRRSRSFQC